MNKTGNQIRKIKRRSNRNQRKRLMRERKLTQSVEEMYDQRNSMINKTCTSGNYQKNVRNLNFNT